MEDKTKIILGSVFLAIGAIGFLLIYLVVISGLINSNLSIFLFIGPLFGLIGTVLLYKGLPVNGQAILLAVIGGVFITATLIPVFLFLTRIDLVIATSLALIVFWSLVFIVPGIYVIGKDRGIRYMKVLLYLDIAGACAFIFGLIFLFAGYMIQTNTGPIYFGDFFLLNFWPFYGLGFLVGLLIDVLVHFNVDLSGFV